MSVTQTRRVAVRLSWGLLGVGLLAGGDQAAGDHVRFKHGGRAEGVVIEETSDTVVVRVAQGLVRIDRATVAEVVRSVPELNGALLTTWSGGGAAATEAPNATEAASPPPQAARPVFDGRYEWVEVGGESHVIFLPVAYTGDRAWPLILSVPDGDQPSWELARAWQNVLPTLSALLVIPSGASAWVNAAEEEARVLRVLDAVESRYAVQPGRVLLTGFGTGAHVVYGIGLRHAERFCALCPIGGSLALAEAWFGPLPVEGAGRSLNILVLHGSSDRVVPFQHAQADVGRLRAAGHRVTLVNLFEGHQYPAREHHRLLGWLTQLAGG